MQPIDIAAEFDRRAAEGYDEGAAHRWQADGAAALTAPEPGWVVLDVATGTGLAARALAARMGNVGEIIGIDISDGMLDIARQKSPGICRYLRADAGHPPFADEHFDGVVCVAGLPYLPEPTAVLAQWRRVCRPPGRVVFTVPADGGISEFRLLQQAASAYEIQLADPNAGMGDERRLMDLVESAGLTCERVTIDAWTEPLTSDPDALCQRFMSYGLAEPLRSAASHLRELVLDDYRLAIRAEHAAGRPALHRVLFARCEIPQS